MECGGSLGCDVIEVLGHWLLITLKLGAILLWNEFFFIHPSWILGGDFMQTDDVDKWWKVRGSDHERGNSSFYGELVPLVMLNWVSVLLFVADWVFASCDWLHH
jgi:hypothetical protein